MALHMRTVEIAWAFGWMLTLAGCGGSGGGAATRPAAPVPLVYPPVNSGQVQLTGQSVHVGIDSATLRSTQLNGTVEGRIDWVGDQPKALVMDFSVPAAALQFSETFDALSARTLDIAPGLRVTVSTEEKIATDGTRRSVLLLHPESAGLRYATLGAWGYAQPSSPTQYDGSFVLGTATRVRDIPVTGSASYAGLMLGTFLDGSAAYDVSAFATAQADFAARTVSFATDLSTRTARGGAGTPVLDPTLNLSGTLSYAEGSNRLAGTLTNASTDMSGQASARFYGPAVRELGGTYFIEKSDKSKQMSGAFAVRR